MKCISAFLSLCLIAAFVVAQPNYDFSKLKREHLGRGVIAIRENPSTVAVSWRYLSSDPMDESFDVYRNGEKVNKYPIRNATFFQDIYKGTESVLYTVKAIQSKTESCYQLPSDAPAGYLNIPLNRPENGTTPAGQSYFYAPNDASIGDVDGDGEYEIILKWDPSNAHDNSHDGYTGEVYFDCYKLNGQHLWRINLGRNIRAGAHYTQFMVFDLDGDGCDEIIYGSCAIDHNGKGLYTTKMGHGDAIHLTHFDPSRKGLQVWDCHENKRDGSTYRDAATGEILFQIKDSTDVGRCMAADIDPTHPGVEMWSLASGGIRNIKGEVVKARVRGLSCNMAVWWDGDLLRELLDRNIVSKYNWKKGVCERIAIFEGALSNNGTKATPCLQGDIVGDWREEVLLRTADNTALRLYVSTIPTDYRFHTFLEDPVYRISIATQNVAYNQPTQPGFYFGPDLQGTLFRGCKIPKK